MDQTRIPIESPIKKSPKRWNKKKLAVISGIIIILLTITVLVSISVKVGLELTKPEKKSIVLFPSDYGIEFRDIQFFSNDGETKLSGWVLEPEVPVKMNLIFAHGYKGNRYEENIPFFPLANDLLLKGYRIVMFDFRYAGESEGKMTTVGAKEKLDVIGAVDWVTEHYDEPVGLLGISMGGAASIMAAAQSEKVAAVVADSSFSDLYDYLKVNLPVWTDLPDFPFTPLILTIIPLITDLDPKEASPMTDLAKVAPRPVLFIHNKKDDKIPYKESEKMVEVNPNIFDIWLTNGAGHVKSFEQNPAAYVNKVDEFFEKVLNEN